MYPPTQVYPANEDFYAPGMKDHRIIAPRREFAAGRDIPLAGRKPDLLTAKRGFGFLTVLCLLRHFQALASLAPLCLCARRRLAIDAVLHSNAAMWTGLQFKARRAGKGEDITVGWRRCCSPPKHDCTVASVGLQGRAARRS